MGFLTKREKRAIGKFITSTGQFTKSQIKKFREERKQRRFKKAELIRKVQQSSLPEKIKRKEIKQIRMKKKQFIGKGILRTKLFRSRIF